MRPQLNAATAVAGILRTVPPDLYQDYVERARRGEEIVFDRPNLPRPMRLTRLDPNDRALAALAFDDDHPGPHGATPHWEQAAARGEGIRALLAALQRPGRSEQVRPEGCSRPSDEQLLSLVDDLLGTHVPPLHPAWLTPGALQDQVLGHTVRRTVFQIDTTPSDFPLVLAAEPDLHAWRVQRLDDDNVQLWHTDAVVDRDLIAPAAAAAQRADRVGRPWDRADVYAALRPALD